MKGLQKLKYFCQMCAKQCRDANAFKCHTTSESHFRKMELFREQAHEYLKQFSEQFVRDFLEVVRRQFGSKRVSANRVYQDYIAERNHVHMNSTHWTTLSDFVKYLGKTGKCVVDETEKGWFITYIDRHPETIAALEKQKKKEKSRRDDDCMKNLMKRADELRNSIVAAAAAAADCFKKPLERKLNQPKSRKKKEKSRRDDDCMKNLMKRADELRNSIVAAAAAAAADCFKKPLERKLNQPVIINMKFKPLNRKLNLSNPLKGSKRA
ncbi:unnamed protein product [Trichogramma brassicae]|uniref:C2H2-type domain-containing protein n=1 Tax=Trichogramma brassicae TaxID=86971 RepID=A0A6H5J099_9HYME|nr:unnamed protein product [Trichogramma brassicae]